MIPFTSVWFTLFKSCTKYLWFSLVIRQCLRLTALEYSAVIIPSAIAAFLPIRKSSPSIKNSSSLPLPWYSSLNIISFWCSCSHLPVPDTLPPLCCKRARASSCVSSPSFSISNSFLIYCCPSAGRYEAMLVIVSSNCPYQLAPSAYRSSPVIGRIAALMHPFPLS